MFRKIALCGALISGMATGCASTAANNDFALLAGSDIPRELQKVSHPVYRVAPPDILQIEAVHNIRPAGDRLRAGDVLNVQLGNPAPLETAIPGATPQELELRTNFDAGAKFLNGQFAVQADGTLRLGPVYGKVHVAGKTVDEAENAIREHLKRYAVGKDGKRGGIRDPKVSVSLPDVTGKQVITGQHLIRPDGTVSLGVYGSVHVAGMTLAEVKTAIEGHLTQFIHEPEVSTDVLAYNSKVYYVITDGGGFGETVVRLPCTGNETVLDAIANIQGLSQVSSRKIWVARPAPAGAQTAQVLDVNWREITKEGITTTNYQLLPGDRIYIAADHMIAFDNFLSKMISPFERIAGFILLGHGTVRSLQFGHLQNGGNAGAGGGGFGF